MDVAKIQQHLQDNFETDLEDIRAFLRQPSISYTGEGIKETGEWIIRWIESLGGTARLVPVEGGYHPVVYGRIDSGSPRTLLIYGMYDIMPADEPGWIAPPFAAEIHDWEDQGPCIINRGSTNTKGPLMSFLTTLRAIIAVEGKLPVNLIFAIEGEEEYGSRSFHRFVADHLDELKDAEAMLFPMFGRDVDGKPAIRLGTKGPLYFELKCTGGDWGGPTTRGVHGSNNVWVASPVWRLVKALSTMVDEDQRVTIDGFHDQVRKPTPEDIELCRTLAATRPPEIELRTHDVTRIKWDMDAFTAYITAQTQPQLNIDGIWGGYTGAGTKTLLPHEATVKMDIRMVPDMEPDATVELVRRHLDAHGYGDIDMKVINNYTWSKVSLKEPIVQALVETFRQMGQEPAIYPLNIGSAPFYVFDRMLKIPYVFGGMGHGARAHSSNEYISVPGILDFEKSMVHVLDNYLRLAAE
jgi:acetylornithine deacetylase/succinyl-diaminopimelate desuccinylase-like protein